MREALALPQFVHQIADGPHGLATDHSRAPRQTGLPGTLSNIVDWESQICVYHIFTCVIYNSSDVSFDV